MFDTHAHLDHFENLEPALRNAAASGVAGILAVSMDLASMRRNLQIAGQFTAPRIYVGLGIHPANVKAEELEESLQFMREQMPRAAVIGEIGLDFWYKWVRKDKALHELQRLTFRRQLELAKEFDRPVVIHARGTWRECLTTVQEIGINRAVFHWYSGPLDVLKDILAAGYFISASPALSSSPPCREAVAETPIERVLIETDCPVFYRYPGEENGFTAEPKDVWYTLKVYAQLKAMDEPAALAVFDQNARRFIGI